MSLRMGPCLSRLPEPITIMFPSAASSEDLDMRQPRRSAKEKQQTQRGQAPPLGPKEMQLLMVHPGKEPPPSLEILHVPATPPRLRGKQGTKSASGASGKEGPAGRKPPVLSTGPRDGRQEDSEHGTSGTSSPKRRNKSSRRLSGSTKHNDRGPPGQRPSLAKRSSKRISSSSSKRVSSSSSRSLAVPPFFDPHDVSQSSWTELSLESLQLTLAQAAAVAASAAATATVAAVGSLQHHPDPNLAAAMSAAASAAAAASSAAAAVLASLQSTAPPSLHRSRASKEDPSAALDKSDQDWC